LVILRAQFAETVSACGRSPVYAISHTFIMSFEDLEHIAERVEQGSERRRAVFQ
jgi:hypothetical protein